MPRTPYARRTLRPIHRLRPATAFPTLVLLLLATTPAFGRNQATIRVSARVISVASDPAQTYRAMLAGYETLAAAPATVSGASETLLENGLIRLSLTGPAVWAPWPGAAPTPPAGAPAGDGGPVMLVEYAAN